MLDTLTADALTDVGGADGTGGEVERLPTRINILQVTHTYFTYIPPIQPEITYVVHVTVVLILATLLQ